MEYKDGVEHNQEVEDQDLEEAVFGEPAILINLGQLYQPNMGKDFLYEATRSLLSINFKRAKKIRIACAVYQGFIKEVYIVSQWLKADEWGKYYFEGEVATDEFREKYVGKSVASYWKRGSLIPIKYAFYTVNGKKYKS